MKEKSGESGLVLGHHLLAAPLSSVVFHPTRHPECGSRSLMGSPLHVGDEAALPLASPAPFLNT